MLKLEQIILGKNLLKQKREKRENLLAVTSKYA